MRLECQLVKVPFLIVSQQKATVVFDVALAVLPIRNNTFGKMLLKRGMENGEWGMGNWEWDIENGILKIRNWYCFFFTLAFDNVE